MSISEINKNRIRDFNSKPFNEQGKYILYWMQAYRRLEHNHSLDYAVHLSKKYKKNLVIYEGLRSDYPWNSERIHRFILEGMIDNRNNAEKLGFNYWSFAETSTNNAKGLLKKISREAFAVVTDDFPCFIIPGQTHQLSEAILCKLLVVDGNSIIPLKLYGKFASAARILRPRIHKLFSEAYIHQAKSRYSPKEISFGERIYPPFFEFSEKNEDIDTIIKKIKFQNPVSSVSGMKGGRNEALKKLKKFIQSNICEYGENRSNPHSPKETPVSGLSPYLHFGHISVEEIIIEALNYNSKNKWGPDLLRLDLIGDKNFYHKNESINSFLDELITWRDIGFLMFYLEPGFNKNLDNLPEWVFKNFAKHRKDKREYIYSKDQFEQARTHDLLWNSAQKELVITGRMHNYMRMLWGKKIIEWSSSYEEAFQVLEDLNNKYAYDGRNPNSYTGILWCFGLFDRPWFPERNVLGNLRYLSSDSTMKKFKMKEYLNYVENLSSDSLLF